jgi:hypothetical protein
LLCVGVGEVRNPEPSAAFKHCVQFLSPDGAQGRKAIDRGRNETGLYKREQQVALRKL